MDSNLIGPSSIDGNLTRCLCLKLLEEAITSRLVAAIKNNGFDYLQRLNSYKNISR